MKFIFFIALGGGEWCRWWDRWWSSNDHPLQIYNLIPKGYWQNMSSHLQYWYLREPPKWVEHWVIDDNLENLNSIFAKNVINIRIRIMVWLNPCYLKRQLFQPSTTRMHGGMSFEYYPRRLLCRHPLEDLNGSKKKWTSHLVQISKRITSIFWQDLAYLFDWSLLRTMIIIVLVKKKWGNLPLGSTHWHLLTSHCEICLKRLKLHETETIFM